MDLLVTARVFVEELVKEELIEVRRANVVGRDLAKLIADHGRPPSGPEVEQWLEDHRLVVELFADADLLDEALFRHFGAAYFQPALVRQERHPDLERQIRDSPGRVEHYLVYSDWLQERSDPLGELIALGVAATDGSSSDVARFERFLKAYKDHVLGAATRRVLDQVKLSWSFGFVHTIDAATRLDEETWEQLLKLRLCGFIQTIKVGLQWSDGLDEVLCTIGRCAPGSLGKLALRDCHNLSIPETLLQLDLRELSISGTRVFVPDPLPESLDRLSLNVREIDSAASRSQKPARWNIRELQVNVTPQTSKFLGVTKLGRLERLGLDIGNCTGLELTELLQTIELPSVTHLELFNGQLDATTLGAIGELRVARQLTSLALTRLDLTDQVMQALTAASSWFGGLSVIDVSHNELSGEGLAAARAFAPEVISWRQDRPGTAAHGRLRRFAGSRLQVAQTITAPKLWRRAGIDDDLLWARYRGGAEYELFVARDLSRYGCSCPSSIQPCKHVVALLLVAETNTLSAAPSDGVEDRVRNVAQTSESELIG